MLQALLVHCVVTNVEGMVSIVQDHNKTRCLKQNLMSTIIKTLSLLAARYCHAVVCIYVNVKLT